MVTNWNTMHVRLQQMIHHCLSPILYILLFLSVVLQRMALIFLLLMAIRLRKPSLKQNFHTKRMQNILDGNVIYLLMEGNLTGLTKQFPLHKQPKLGSLQSYLSLEELRQTFSHAIHT